MKIDWPNILVGTILGILSTIIFYYFANRNFQKELEKSEPNINLEIYELAKNSLKLRITSNNELGAEVKKLFFSFDIPGVLLKKVNEHKYLVGNCEIFVDGYNSGSKNSIDGPMDIRFSETLKIECSSIMPKGVYEVDLIYSPSDSTYRDAWLSWPINAKFSHLFKYKSFDFHDYEEINFYWDFSGRLQNKRQCVDLTNLNYIQKDNERTVELFNAMREKIDLKEYERRRSPCFN